MRTPNIMTEIFIPFPAVNEEEYQEFSWGTVPQILTCYQTPPYM